MKKDDFNFREKLTKAFVLVLLLSIFPLIANAQYALRRPLSPTQPMWQIHIDVWNTADPQRIIDLIPADIRPYVVMNVSMSINHDQTTGQFLTSEYGYETCKSWVRTCAENNIWCMVQQSSGGLHHFSETDLSVYEEFFKDYPNFIGFNYAEQFWGFDIPGDPVSSTWTGRMNFFSKLLEIHHRYGGYLTVSWCGNQWSPNINPIAMMKRVPAFAQACRDYTENFILCEKYTQGGYIQDMESLCYGAYLSGYSGHYGIRYDETGWTGPTGTHDGFTPATGLAPHLEHVMLTGMTVIDGPELIWLQCFRETGAVSTSNGFSRRNWERRAQFDNVSIDLYRKILDGTIRIPSRQELIDRTKFVIINNVNTGSADNIYSSPTDLFQGLYRMDNDGNLKDNHSFFKKTGRYPTVPTVYQLDDAMANTFQFKVNRSAYSTRWPSITAKVNEFNTQFPSEYTGTIYAGRHENGWVLYNPIKDGTIATGNIPFKYNTCSSMDVSFSLYSAGVLKETANQLKLYLNNYDNVLNTGLKTDIIKINGCSSQPTFTFTDRGNHSASNVTSSFAGGVLTLTIQHNGGLDLTINCSGTATGRLTNFTAATLVRPADPPLYTGPHQYEAENMEYKSIGSIRGNGTGGSIRNYQGLGYMVYGTNASASARATVKALVAGNHKLDIRYAVTGNSVTNIDLYVNGTKVSTPTFTATSSLSDWATYTQTVTLNAGNNTLELRSTGSRASAFHFDNIILTAPTTVNIPPTVSITAPAANATFTAPAAITINANAADTDGTISNVQFFNGTTLLGTDASAPYSFAWTNVTPGTYSITARATDNTGAVTTSAAVSVTVNPATNNAPAVSITAPATNASFTAPATISFVASATDTDGTITNVFFYNGATLIQQEWVAPYAFDWTNVPAGTYTITAVATDNSGATTTSAAVIVTVASPTNIPPTVSITAPANNASFSAPASINLAANAADTDGSIANVAFFNGTTLLGTDATEPYSFAWTNVAAGTYTITASATDNVGAVTTSTIVTVVVTSSSTADVIGPDCGSNNMSLNFNLNTANRANVTSYNWWYTGSAGSITMAAGAPYSATIQAGPNFSNGDVCVGTNLSVAPWYKQYCKSISNCNARNSMDPTDMEETGNSNANVLPNPSTNDFILTSNREIEKVVVLNETGSLVYQSITTTNRQPIVFGNDFNAGIYSVGIYYTDGKFETRKIVKLK